MDGALSRPDTSNTFSTSVSVGIHSPLTHTRPFSTFGSAGSISGASVGNEIGNEIDIAPVEGVKPAREQIYEPTGVTLPPLFTSCDFEEGSTGLVNGRPVSQITSRFTNTTSYATTTTSHTNTNTNTVTTTSSSNCTTTTSSTSEIPVDNNPLHSLCDDSYFL